MKLLGRIAKAVRAWGRQHSYSLFSSLGALLRNRLGTVMTVTVLGIALVLPLVLLVTLHNLRQLDQFGQQLGSLSAYMESAAGSRKVADVAAEVRQWSAVHEVSIITPEQALSEFRQASGFGASIDALETNPLPYTLLIEPQQSGSAAGEIDGLLERLNAHADIDVAEYDLKWLQRLSAMLSLGEAIAQVLGVLFALAVMMVIANTIRLDVQNRYEEIEVLSLVGASRGFIRKPFLYAGFWYGSIGGVLALIFLGVMLVYLKGPIGQLVATYESGFRLTGLSWVQGLTVILLSGVLGWLGAWLAVQKYLRGLRLQD